MEKENFFVKNKSILTFLILEVVALTAFNFGNISYIFGLAGALIAIVGVFFLLEIEEDKRSLLFILIPTGLLLVISLIGSFNAFSKGFSTLSNISLLFSLPSFLLIGFYLRKLNDVKTRTVLIVIGGALAAITIFGLFSTIFEYGFFYKLIYKNKPNYYYNGIPYDVTKEMYWLIGFGFTEVYVEYGSLFAILTASFLPGLLFLSPKKDRNDFIISAAIGGVGLITLLVLPNFKAIFVLVAASLFALIYKFFKNNKKVVSIAGISFVSLLGILALFFILTLVNVAIGYKFPGFLNRVFVQNGIMKKVTSVIEAMFMKVGGKLSNFFGLMPTISNEKVTWLETNMFEVQLLKELGLIGTILFGVFLVMMGYFVWQYIKKNEDSDCAKNIFVVMILSFLIYESLFNLIVIGPHIDSYESFLRSPTLLVILFIFGYIFTTPSKKEIKQHE